MAVPISDYGTIAKPDWCPGCGNFGIQLAVKQALANLELNPDQVAYVSDIGCSGKMPHWINTYGLHSLHGRAIPCATGVKFANRDLTVLVSAGDGGAYGIGLNHLLQAIKRNVNITLLVHHNLVYGLTKGQMTPTSSKGYKSPSTPFGVIAEPLNPLALALAAGGTFVARGFVGNMPQLTELIMAGIKHKGFALVDILQPCVTFNKVQTYDYYRKNTYNLTDLPAYKHTDWSAAIEKARQTDQLPLGIFYREERPTYEDQDPARTNVPAVNLPLSNINIDSLMARLY